MGAVPTRLFRAHQQTVLPRWLVLSYSYGAKNATVPAGIIPRLESH